MALKKFARRDVILPAVVFLLTFAVALFKSGRPCITKTAPRLGCCFCYGPGRTRTRDNPVMSGEF